MSDDGGPRLDDGDNLLLPEYRDHLARFPDVGSALAAARRGEDASLYLINDGLRTFMTVTPDEDGPGGVVEHTYYLDWWDALESAVMNAQAEGEPDKGVIVDAAVSWVQAEIAGIEAAPGGSLKAVALADGEGIDSDGYCPLLAVRERLPVTGAESWDALDSPAYGELTSLSESVEFVPAPPTLLRALRAAGARIVACSECGEFLTNAVPEFPGVWFTLHETSGPICGGWSWPPQAHAPRAWQDVDAEIAGGLAESERGETVDLGSFRQRRRS